MADYQRAVTPPPRELATGGQPNFGTFSGPIERVNPLDIPNPLGVKLPRALNNLRLKEWQAFQIMSPEWFICLAVYNTKSLGTAIVMAYNRTQDRLYRYERLVPAPLLKIPAGLDDSYCYYHGPGFRIDILNELKQDRFRVAFAAKNFKGLPDINASFVARHVTEPIVIVQPFGPNRPLYSHKALMPAEGHLIMNGRESVFEPGASCMIVDDHKGFYPYTMRYDWVTGCGYDAQGRLIGFNLTDNQVKDHSRYNENCLWLDGKMIPLPPIKVSRPDGVLGTWQARDEYDQVKIDFKPLKDVPININLGLIVTRYHGPTGLISGTIQSPDGQLISFDGLPGMGEQKYIRM